jgi:hypothetical protein
MNMAFTMACPNFKKDLKMAFGLLGVNTHFNKKSPQAHTESELDVLAVHGKVVKYAVHSSKRKK